jgi:hypothetical protein
VVKFAQFEGAESANSFLIQAFKPFAVDKSNYRSLKKIHNLLMLYCTCGVRGSVVVKALCYKPEGRGFETR